MSGPLYDHTDASRTDPDTGPVRVWAMHGPHGRYNPLRLKDGDTDRRLKDSDAPGTATVENVRALELPQAKIHAVGVCPDCGRLGYATPATLHRNGKEARLCGADFDKVAVRHARDGPGPRPTCYVPVEKWDRDGGA